MPETVIDPLNTVETTVDDTVSPAVQELDTLMTDKELKKEMIRQAMSELGKRSAASRAKKKMVEGLA